MFQNNEFKIVITRQAASRHNLKWYVEVKAGHLCIGVSSSLLFTNKQVILNNYSFDFIPVSSNSTMLLKVSKYLPKYI